MQRELIGSSEQAVPPTSSHSTPPTSQYGSPRPEQSVPDARFHAGSGSRGASPHSAPARRAAQHPDGAVDAHQVDEKLRRLSGGDDGRAKMPVAGQRITEYERAMTPSIPRQAFGFRVVKRSGSPSHGVQLIDFPSEILTHIISHLHPDSHSAVALVSKRFYSLVTTPHAWRMGFIRYFPGQEAVDSAASRKAIASGQDTTSGDDVVRSESRYFTRLTSLASWRSEYLLRTRLLRSIARGKPGNSSTGAPGAAAPRSNLSGKRHSAVLTYNSKLPWLVTNVHAIFTSGKKSPRAIHGSSDFCIATVSDPTNGKVEKWGLDDPFSFAQLDEVFPQLQPYGLGDGPAAVPNVMDVSQPYGIVGGEGFPGGRAYFRAVGDVRGRYLDPQERGIIDPSGEIPKIPELSDGICSVWIAKSSAVPSMTQSMVGIMTGSSLGIVTSYALRYDSSGARYANGDITARWVLSPGVPIIAIKVDDSYSVRRKTLGRVWAVALNALGEVYYLQDVPTPPATRASVQDLTRVAWHTGRTAYWELIESTRRIARPDDFDKNAVRGAYSPRSPSSSMNLSPGQLAAEAREIEKFLRHKPAHFRKVCDGWDMRRRLEVDFGGGDESSSAGEGVFVITSGCDKVQPAQITRYARRHCGTNNSGTNLGAAAEGAGTPSSPVTPDVKPSIFGGVPSAASTVVAPQKAEPRSATPVSPALGPVGSATSSDDWRATSYSLKSHGSAEVTSSAIDLTTYALLSSFEDPLCGGGAAGPGTPGGAITSSGEIPGRRARLMAVGTKTGAVIVWNMRASSRHEVTPVRVIQTESPEVSCLALSALYLVHGGSDGLVQAWDPLGSTLDPIRTLNSRSSGRLPRHLAHANPALRNANFAAVGAIYLGPDPTVLRGILSFGTFLRYWTYSSTGQSPSRKRRNRPSDIHGRLASRRQGGAVMGYIAAEEAELRREQEHRMREQARLRSRFGVGLGDLTEEEAVRYAEMVSQESFLLEEQRRLSASDTGSAADMSELGSSASGASTDTITPEPSMSGLASPPTATAAVATVSAAGPSSSAGAPRDDPDDDYELQIQRAIRLSLMEGVNDAGESPRGNSSGEYEFQVRYTSSGKKDKGGKRSSPTPSTPLAVADNGPTEAGASASADMDDDVSLQLALRLSLEEEEQRQARVAAAAAATAAGFGILEGDEFPALEVKGKGKGKLA